MQSIHIQCKYSSCTIMKICLLLIFLPFVFCLPSLPSHSFDKRIFLSKKSVYDDVVGDHSVTTKKVFITFVQGPYIFKKRRENRNRVTFTCNGCQKVNHYLVVSCGLIVTRSMMSTVLMVTLCLDRLTTCVGTVVLRIWLDNSGRQ